MVLCRLCRIVQAMWDCAGYVVLCRLCGIMQAMWDCAGYVGFYRLRGIVQVSERRYHLKDIHRCSNLLGFNNI